MTTLRIEPFSGISGDMMLGALVALGADPALLMKLPATLGLDGATVKVGTVSRCGIQCVKADIADDTEPVHRHLSQIETMILGADLPAAAQEFALKVFRIIGEAEAQVHGVPVEKVHFHEVGAVDSILDIVGAAVLLDSLGIDQAVSAPVCVGSGFVNCAHGRLPVPAPATALILHGMPTYPGEIAKEMTTPTGAALLKALAPTFETPVMTTTATGYGAGSREFDQPNCLRLSLGTIAKVNEDVWQVQTNLDDTTGELLGAHLQDLLLERGALDLNLCPVVMKKGRPGHRLEALCLKEDLETLVAAILEETTTIGVRFFPVTRTVLPRTMETISGRYGAVTVKAVTLPSGRVRRTPEFEDCRRLAKEAGVAVRDVMAEALRICAKADAPV